MFLRMMCSSVAVCCDAIGVGCPRQTTAARRAIRIHMFRLDDEPYDTVLGVNSVVDCATKVEGVMVSEGDWAGQTG